MMKIVYDRTTDNQPQSGFTIVEVIVTVIIVALFALGFFQSYMLIESQRLSVMRQARANDIAYSNLKKVSSRTSIVCDSTTTSTGYDLFQYSGYVAEPNSVTSQLKATSVTQELKAYATGSDCSSFATTPVKIVSKVTYTVNGTSTEVVHASYVQ